MAEYDPLKIRIEVDSSDAKSSIKSFSSSLTKLGEKASELDVERLKEIQKLLLDISKIDFTNVVKGLDSVVKAFNSLNSKAIKAGKKGTVAGVDLGGTREARSGASGDYRNVLSADYYKNLDITPANDTLEALKSELAKTSEWVNKVSESYTFLADKTGQVVTVEKKLNKTLDETNTEGKSVATTISKIIKSIKNLKKGTDSSTKSLEKWFKQFIRITKYRIIRKVIQEIYKALTQGIQGVALFDDSFNDTMSNLTSSLKYLSNSLGSLLAPVIQLLEPILTTLIQGLAEATNAFAEFFAAINGQDTFVKAKFELDDYRESLKKTAALGIDELNVISPESQGFTTEEVKVSEEMKKNLSAVKDLMSAITDLLGQFFEVLNDLTKSLLPAITSIIVPLAKIITRVINLIMHFVDTTFKDANESIASFLTLIGEIVDLIYELVDNLLPIIRVIVDALGIGTNSINKYIGSISSYLALIVSIIKPILSILRPIADLIEIIFEIFSFKLRAKIEMIFAVINSLIAFFKTVWETIVAIFDNDFDRIGELWGELGNKLKGIWAGVANFFIGVINKLIFAFRDFVNWFIDKAAIVAQWFGTDTSNWGILKDFEGIPTIQYATGGFPEDGLFFANHNELIGKFTNGQTVVANNEQIVEGIKQGVMEAMAASGNAGDINVYIDGQEVAKVVNKINNNRGSEVLYGGTLKYGR